MPPEISFYRSRLLFRMKPELELTLGGGAMSHECFEVSVEGKVAHVKMARPERCNAMTAAFWNELPAIVRELDATGRVLIGKSVHLK